jgi:hypothetical protein
VASQRQRGPDLGPDTNPFVLPANLFPTPYWKGYSRKEDEELAEQLFFGRTVRDKTSRAKKRYLTKDSVDERSAREALVRLLSRNDCVHIKVLLCDALKSDGKGERRLVFQSRNKGKRSDISADFTVAFHVRLLTNDGAPVESAVRDAMQKFGLSRKAVFECYKRAKKRYRDLGANIF